MQSYFLYPLKLRKNLNNCIGALLIRHWCSAESSGGQWTPLRAPASLSPWTTSASLLSPPQHTHNAYTHRDSVNVDVLAEEGFWSLTGSLTPCRIISPKQVAATRLGTSNSRSSSISCSSCSGGSSSWPTTKITVRRVKVVVREREQFTAN